MLHHARQRVTLTVLFGLLVGATAAGGQDATTPATRVLMEEITAAFRGIVKGLEIVDGNLVPGHASRLRSSCLKLREVRKSEAVFVEHCERIAELAVEVSSLAERSLLVEAKPVLDDIRGACVSCHLRFRSEKLKGEMFPAVGNTLAGRVVLLTVDGEPRKEAPNVVVFLDEAAVGGEGVPPRRKVIISQKERVFAPRVLPVLTGTTVVFPNDDTIFHNVFSLSKTKPFDLDIYKPGQSKSVTFDRPGLVRIYCNIHPDMVCSVVVLNNPYFTVTDPTGFFVITGVPDGKYTLRAWNELSGRYRQKVSVAGNSLSEFSLEVREKRRSMKHKNKFGKPYPKKY